MRKKTLLIAGLAAIIMNGAFAKPEARDKIKRLKEVPAKYKKSKHLLMSCTEIKDDMEDSRRGINLYFIGTHGFAELSNRGEIKRVYRMKRKIENEKKKFSGWKGDQGVLLSMPHYADENIRNYQGHFTDDIEPKTNRDFPVHCIKEGVRKLLVIAYDRAFYKGNSTSLGLGDYALANTSIGAKDLSSIKIPRARQVSVCTKADGGGKCWTLTGDNPKPP